MEGIVLQGTYRLDHRLTEDLGELIHALEQEQIMDIERANVFEYDKTD